MQISRISAAVLAAGLVSVGHAETKMEPIVVSATRTPITVDDSLASVTVLTRKDIQKKQPEDVPALLSDLIGVDLSRNGGLGKQTSLFLRGTNSDHVLVLVDGVRIGSATLGKATLENLPVSEIDRIEVVRGPRSSLYGSDAIGGIIQIFTRGDDTHVSIGGGSNGTFESAAGAGVRGERGSFGVNVSQTETSGFDARENDSPAGNEPDKDGFRQRGLSAHGSYRFSDGTRLRLSTLQDLEHNEYDGMPNSTDSRHQVYAAKLATRPTSWWDLHLTGGYDTEKDDNMTDGVRTSSFETERRTAGIQNDFAIGGSHLTTVGVDYRRDHVDSTQSFTKNRRTDLGYYLQHQWFGDVFNAQAGLRYDHDSAFGGHTTGNVALGARFAGSGKVYASFGTAYKAPTFNGLYWPSGPFTVGNPDLDPETSRTYEVGVRYGRSIRLSANVYRTEAHDLIVWASDPATGKFKPQNVNGAVINGAELGATTTLAGVRTELGLTYLDPEDSETGNQLPRRARKHADLDLSRSFGALTLGGHAQYRSKRYDDLSNQTRLAPYTVVDLRAGYQISPDWKLTGKVGNVFDRNYQTADTYNTWGRHYLATLTWQPRSGK